LRVIEESQSFFYTVLHVPACKAIFQATFFSTATYFNEAGEGVTYFAWLYRCSRK